MAKIKVNKKEIKEKFDALTNEQKLIIRNYCSRIVIDKSEELKKLNMPKENTFDYDFVIDWFDTKIKEYPEESEEQKKMKSFRSLFNKEVNKSCYDIVEMFEYPSQNTVSQDFKEEVISIFGKNCKSVEQLCTIGKESLMYLKISLILDEINNGNLITNDAEFTMAPETYLAELLKVDSIKLEEKLNSTEFREEYFAFRGSYLEMIYEKLYLMRVEKMLEELIESIGKNESGSCYLYRAGRNDTREYISAVNRESRKNEMEHVSNGTRSTDSPFISATKSFMVMLTYISREKGKEIFPMAIDLVALLNMVSDRLEQLEGDMIFSKEKELLEEIGDNIIEIDGVSIQEAAHEALLDLKDIPMYSRETSFPEDIIDLSSDDKIQTRRKQKGKAVKGSRVALESDKRAVDERTR